MKEKFDDKDIDQLFKDKFSGEETAPREIVWTKINQQLGEKDRRPVAWIWWLSGLVLVMGISLFLLFGTNQNNKLAVHSDSVKKESSIENKNETKNIAETKQITNKNNSDSVKGSMGVDDNPDYQYEKGTANKKNVIEKQNPVTDNSGNKIISQKKTNQVSTNQTKQKNPLVSNQKRKSSSVTSYKSDNPVVSDYSNSEKSNSFENNSTAKKSDQHNNTKDSSQPTNTKPIDSFTYQAPLLAHDEIVEHNQIKKIPQDQKKDSIIEKKKSIKDSILPDERKETIVENTSLVRADSILPQKQNDQITKTDSTKLPVPDSSLTQTLQHQAQQDPVSMSQFVFPKYFASLHGAVDAEKILQSTVKEDDYDDEDVAVYDETKLKSIPQQTYSFGARFGWFLNNRISLTGGAYYSIFQSESGEGDFRFNHNNSYTFSMHTATSSVQCASSKFDLNDAYHRNYDTVYIAIQSQERYDYVNLQLGFSFYALRKKHFGLYADLLSNGAILAKQEITLTVPYSGKSLAYSGNQLKGMNKFVMGGQTGLGFEYLPFGNLGLWAEPSFYFSGSLNKKNAVNLQPGGMRYLFGLIYHF